MQTTVSRMELPSQWDPTLYRNSCQVDLLNYGDRLKVATERKYIGIVARFRIERKNELHDAAKLCRNDF